VGLETSPTLFSDLNSAWPPGTDPRSEGDDHIRNLKTVLKTTFSDTSTSFTITKGAATWTFSTTGFTTIVPITLPSDPTTALQAATKQYVDLRELAANKGAANGYAPLDASTKIAATYLPAYVDDVLEYANLAAFPATGTAGIIYIALDTNKTYRWGGSSYTEISPSPGSSDAVPEGSVNLYYTNARASLKADLASPAFTGTPTVPTATAGTNTTQAASTAFVASAIAGFSSGASVSDSAPSSPTNGQLWLDSTTMTLYIWYTDPNTSQWVQIGAN
jgi:hypothetical protein